LAIPHRNENEFLTEIKFIVKKKTAGNRPQQLFINNFSQLKKGLRQKAAGPKKLERQV